VPEAQSDGSGPATDRAPGDPPPCKGASRGSLQERAGSRHISQLASSRWIHSLSGNATPLESIQYKVYAPSNYPASSQAGSSQSQVPDEECIAGSTRVATGSGQTGYVCGNWPPSSMPES
jgi:hypothetical protein